MEIKINCNVTEYEINPDKKYQTLEFSITKHALIISFCDCFGTEITASEISIEDARKLANIILNY
jgi:hypothetical protein